LKDKTAVVTLKQGVPLEPEKFRKAIRKAGYDTRDFELTLRARVERRGEAYQLRPFGVAQTFAARSGGATGQLENFASKLVRAKAKVVSESPTIELELTEIEPAGG
jgi:hypothetical protein